LKKPAEVIKSMTLYQLLRNIENDLLEDADSGIRMDMTVEEYLTSLYEQE